MPKKRRKKGYRYQRMQQKLYNRAKRLKKLMEDGGKRLQTTTLIVGNSSESFCTAFGCSNNKSRQPEKHFFQFPNTKERCRLWMILTKRQDLLDKDTEYIHKNFLLCEDHFTTDNFTTSRKESLVWNAIPTMFPADEEANNIYNEENVIAIKEEKDATVTESPIWMCDGLVTNINDANIPEDTHTKLESRLEKRRRRNRDIKRRTRASESDEARAARLAQMREAKRRARAAKTDEAREASLAQNREAMRRARAATACHANQEHCNTYVVDANIPEDTHTKRESRLEKKQRQNRELKQRTLASESDEARETRLARNREAKRRSRAATACHASQEHCNTTGADANKPNDDQYQVITEEEDMTIPERPIWMCDGLLTDEARAARLAQMREAKRRARAAETDEAREARLAHNREAKRRARAVETDEARPARLAHMREAKRRARAAETDEARAARLAQNREAKRRARAAGVCRESLEYCNTHFAAIFADASMPKDSHILREWRRESESETYEARDTRLAQMCEAKGHVHAAETDKAQDTLLAQMCEVMHYEQAAESNEAQDARRPACAHPIKEEEDQTVMEDGLVVGD